MTDLVRLARARALGSTGEGQRVRLAARITFREMGRRVGVPQSSIVQWESGKTWPSEEAALRWLDAVEELQTVLDGPTDTGEPYAYPKDAGEFAARWNAKTVQERDELVTRLVSDSRRSLHCYQANHDEEIERLRAVIIDHAFNEGTKDR